VAQLSALLDADTVLLEYLVGDSGAAVAVLKGGAAPRVVQLTADVATIRKQVEDLRRLLQSDGSEKWRAAADALRQTVVTPVAADLADCKRVVIVPYDRLHYVPWSVLFDEQISVVTLPSASVLQFCRAKKSGAGAPVVYALGNVEQEGLPALPGTLQEGAAVTKSFSGARLFSERGFTVETVRNGTGGAQVVHFATHGILEPWNPDASAIVTADGRIPVRA